MNWTNFDDKKFLKNQLNLDQTSTQFGSRRTLITQRLVSPNSGQIDAFEQPVQLLHGQLDDALILAWPDEAFSLQAFLQQPKSVAAPAQDFDAVARAIGEDVGGLGKRVKLQIVLDQRGQAVDVLPEIDVVTVLNRPGF